MKRASPSGPEVPRTTVQHLAARFRSSSRLGRAAVVLPLAAIVGAGALAAQPGERVASPVRVTGLVFHDQNGNRVRDGREPGLPGVAVSDQVTVVTTDAQGRFALDAAGYGFLAVTPPDGYVMRGRLWRRAEPGVEFAFPLVKPRGGRSFTFVHASDPHLSPESLPRTRRLRAMVDSLKPAFVLVTGDLVRDALRVTEAEARGYYEMLIAELDRFSVPVFTVPGNHEIFGIERHRSLVAESHPFYGKRMYRSYLGPNYYSFDYGGLHFMGLDTVDYFDLWYQGHVDSVQAGWIREDLARTGPAVRVVTFNHIPLVSAEESIAGFADDNVAPSTIRVGGRWYYRHVVRNAEAVLGVLGDRLEIALGGHVHRFETLRYETGRGTRRFAQAAAVVGPPARPGPMGPRSGITLYRVNGGRVAEGIFVPLDPDTDAR